MDASASPNAKKIIVTHELGLHARPAAQVASLAIEATSNIWVVKNDQQADASSIIDLLTLGCTKGTEVNLRAESPADMPILEKIAALFDHSFLTEDKN